MKHLFITDLDGTLLGPDSRVSDESAGIISSISRDGALVTVATARTPATVEPLLKDTFTAIPAIVLTGASMWDRVNRRFIDPLTLSVPTAERVETSFLAHGINPFVYTLRPDGKMDVLHAPDLTEWEDAFYVERKGLLLKQFEFSDGPFCHIDMHIEKSDPVILLLGIGATSAIQALAVELRADEDVSVSAYPDIFNPMKSYIEVFRTGVSKASAVLRLKDMLGADRVTVYGDHLNDLPMFAVADESVAVANALPEVQAVATRTIGPNTMSSVARDMARVFYSE